MLKEDWKKMCASQIKLSFWKSSVPRGCSLAGLQFELKEKILKGETFSK